MNNKRQKIKDKFLVDIQLTPLELQEYNAIKRGINRKNDQPQYLNQAQYLKYIEGLERERLEPIEDATLEDLIEIQKNSKSLPESSYIAKNKSLQKAALSLRDSILQTDYKRLSIIHRDMEDRTDANPQTQEDKFIDIVAYLNDYAIDMPEINRGMIWENQGFIVFMNEILLASILERIKINDIEYHPYSAKNLPFTHPQIMMVEEPKKTTVMQFLEKRGEITKSNITECDEYKLLSDGSDEGLRNILESWLLGFMNDLIVWEAYEKEKATYFRSSISLSLETYIYKYPHDEKTLKTYKTGDLNQIVSIGHQILLIFEEKWDVSRKNLEYRRFYICDNYADDIEYVFPIHKFIRNMFISEIFPGIIGSYFAQGLNDNTEKAEENERVIEGNPDIYQRIDNKLLIIDNIFTCVSKASRAAILFAFLQDPKSILEQSGGVLRRMEIKYIEKISRYHLVKMACWLLQHHLIVDELYRVTGHVNSDKCHEIKGNDTATILVYNTSSFPGSQEIQTKTYYFHSNSSSILGTFNETKAPPRKLERCTISAPFPSSRHFVIQ